MIKSNLTEDYQNRYLLYIASHYENKWHIYSQGNIIYPVLGLNTLSDLFGIDISNVIIPPKKESENSFEPYCDISGTILTIDQLKGIGFRYKLSDRKAYVDLLVGYNVCRYNNYLTELLVLLADDMYNAIQIHKEFRDSVLDYCKDRFDDWRSDSQIDVDIITGPYGICYKELMDYVHYGCYKPEILFKISQNGKSCRARITEQDYEMRFTETSYNIEIGNICFD